MIDHINIRAPQEVVESVKEFYCGVFQFHVGQRPSFSTPGYWLYAGDHAVIHLSVGERNLSDTDTAYLDHVAFRMRGVTDFCARLESQEIDYKHNYQSDSSVTQIFVTDPSGLRIEANFRGERLTAEGVTHVRR